MTGAPRHILLALLCVPMTGCGFHPLYGGDAKSVNAQLPEIFVANIGGRTGQQLRQSLQQRLAGSSEASPQGYTLLVSYAVNGEAVGIHGDNTSARTRLVGRVNWVLSSVAPTPITLATGSARTIDGYNNIETQYFESTLAGETTYGRMADNLADSITTQIATWFVSHPNGAGTGTAVAESPPAPVIGHPSSFLGPQNVPGDSDQSNLQQSGPDGLPSAAIGR